MKLLLVTCAFLYLVCGQNIIWELMGGNPHGIGSTYNIVTESLALLPAINWSYDLQQTIDWQGTTYLIPDQLYGYSDFSGYNDTEIIIIDTYEAFYNTYVSSWGISAGINIDGISLSLAFSHTQGQINDWIKAGAFNFGTNSNVYYSFYLEMWPGDLPLNPHLNASIQALPDTYNEDAYATFIEYWGTHYLSSAMYGAMFNFTTIFNASFEWQYNDTWTQNQIGISIGFSEFQFGINGSWFDNTTNINQQFANQSNTVHTVVGGDKGVFDASGFDAWWQTCQSNWDVLMVKSNPIPLYELFADAYPTKADNLKNAIIAYGNGKLNRPDLQVDDQIISLQSK